MQIPAALLDRLRIARRVAVLTGAGISAESGVPTFRDALAGLWKDYRPEDLATPEAFIRNPAMVWEWYSWRRELVRAVQPNAGHRALAALAERFEEFTLVTQNVDGLHQLAGSREVIELHGSIARVKCFDRNHPVAAWESDGQIPPRCAECGSLLRPDVVWFGEPLPAEALGRAFEASSRCDVFLSVGTSGLVYPAAGLPRIALDAGATLVEINPTPTPLTDDCDHFLAGPAGVFLPALLEQLNRPPG
ncbi:MAG TPA: NAD-dependent protein deacylase [Verrucomicrobiales bacterium]|nr:NAD-dependent protein deacylase [Verrucomicrobiales bacterium]